MYESAFDERANVRDISLRRAASPDPEVCLMLRADAEMRCLSRQVIPALCEAERTEGVRDDALGAAIAYLEVLWMEAQGRASATEAAFAEAIGSASAAGSSADDLCGKAQRFHTAVSMLRKTVTERIARVLSPASERSVEGVHIAR